jgi:signal transduction histidine kinase
MTATSRPSWIRPARTDVLLAVGLGLAGQLEVWIWWVPDEQGPRLVAALALALMAAAVAWSPQAPMGALCAASAIYAAWCVNEVPQGSLMPMVVLLVLVFGVAARCGRGRAAVGGALGLAAIWLTFVLTDNDFANYAFTGVFVVGSWLAGRGIRSRQARADDFEAHAVRVEREREAKAREAVAEERARIARELHDVVAHSVGVIVIQAQAAQQLAVGEEAVAQSLRSIESNGQQALTEMRRLLGLLRREDEELALAPQPSLRYLDHLAETVREAGLPVDVRVEGDVTPLPPGVDVSAYRIVQEALTNALKHAGPARARVRVRYGAGEVELEISDDGPGPAAGNGGGGGHGLVGMRERVNVYGGVLESGGRPEGGYAVRVRLPFEPARP